MIIKNFLRIAYKYCQHNLNAKSRRGHGVHSPLVFDLCKNVFSKRAKDIKKIEDIRKRLLQSKEKITFTDIGAGSSVEKKKTRYVKEIARYSSSKKVNKLMYKLIEFLKPEQIIEFGTSFGFTTMYMANAHPQSKIITVEGVPEIACIAIKNLASIKNYSVQLVESNFDDFLDSNNGFADKQTLFFLDGNHQKEATLKYFNHLAKHISEESVIVIDDINWSDGMNEAWELIKESKDVSVTIDLFFVGIVFFKKGIYKQDFKIRF
jgi:predicted O-methyltransferase YrrM